MEDKHRLIKISDNLFILNHPPPVEFLFPDNPMRIHINHEKSTIQEIKF